MLYAQLTDDMTVRQYPNDCCEMVDDVRTVGFVTNIMYHKLGRCTTKKLSKNIFRIEVKRMNKRISDTENRRYVNLRTWANYAGIGLNSAKKAAVKIRAEKRIGSRCVYDLQALDEYFKQSDAIELTAEE